MANRARASHSPHWTTGPWRAQGENAARWPVLGISRRRRRNSSRRRCRASAPTRRRCLTTAPTRRRRRAPSRRRCRTPSGAVPDIYTMPKPDRCTITAPLPDKCYFTPRLKLVAPGSSGGPKRHQKCLIGTATPRAARLKRRPQSARGLRLTRRHLQRLPSEAPMLGGSTLTAPRHDLAPSRRRRRALHGANGGHL